MSISTASRTKKVLFVVNFESYFTPFFDLAQRIAATPGYEPIFLFPGFYLNFDRDSAQARQAGIRCIGGNPPVVPPKNLWEKGVRSLKKRWKRKTYDWLLVYVWNFSARYRELLGIYRQERPDILLLGGDVVGHEMCFHIKAGHRLGIKSVLLPSWMETARAPAGMRRGVYDWGWERLGSRVFGRLFPKWVYEYEGEKMLRVSWTQAVALWIMGVAPPRPWSLHSGAADIIAVEGEANRRAGIEDGLEPHKFVVTGSAVHDVMADAVAGGREARRQIYEQHGLSPDKEILLSALPPDLYNHRKGQGLDFESFPEVTEYWLQCLTRFKDRHHVVLTLHPSIDPNSMRHLEEKWGVVIARRRSYEMIPHCKGYVATISATIQWAIACGKPVVNYDLYRMRYPHYVEVPGVLTFEDKPRFMESLNAVFGDERSFAELARLQAVSASDWGLLDGQAVARLLALFRSLMKD